MEETETSIAWINVKDYYSVIVSEKILRADIVIITDITDL
jgi:hypothetical protein